MLFKIPGLSSTYRYLETGIEKLDHFLGGGVPKGKIIELAGEPNVGKTSLIFNIIESLKDTDVVVCYIATSVKSLGFLESRGLDNDPNLVLFINNEEEKIIKFINETIKDVDLFIIDSIAEVLTVNEKGDFDLNIYQDMPRLLGNLNAILYGEDASMIAINHMTTKDNQSVSRWRNIFQRYCSVRVEITNKNTLKILSHKLKPQLVGGILNEL